MVRALDGLKGLLALNGVHDPRHVDLWTALFSGLVSQQAANDPGVRWTGLIEESTDMFLDHCRSAAGREPEPDPPRAEGGLR